MNKESLQVRHSDWNGGFHTRSRAVWREMDRNAEGNVNQPRQGRPTIPMEIAEQVQVAVGDVDEILHRSARPCAGALQSSLLEYFRYELALTSQSPL